MNDFKTGDRIRFPEAIVRVIDDSGIYILFDGTERYNWLSMSKDGVLYSAAVKLAPPLPTTPGSVVRAINNEYHYALSESGEWICMSDTQIKISPKKINTWQVEIKYDAGEAS